MPHHKGLTLISCWFVSFELSILRYSIKFRKKAKIQMSESIGTIKRQETHKI